ncbi:TPA: ead/Ea22-like family protein [Klebsiella aerogenes]|nr:ead/Ea22-like family protein [Klebsiella aerogenes]
MKTDITELAQSLKAAAEKSGVEKWQVKRSGPGEYEVIIKGSLVKRSGWSTHRPVTEGVVDKKTADFIALANPANVLALVEALEKGQKSNEFLKGQLSELANFNPDWDKLEASYESWREIAAELLVAKERIAELESRTVTVKLPSLNPEMFNGDVMFGYHKAQKEAVEFCAAAGIKVEAE